MNVIGKALEELYRIFDILNRDKFNTRTPADVAETLLHEMCHYYNKVNDIKDCSGNIHNKKFKSSAERVGLVVEKGKGVGYGYTSMSEALEAYMNEVVKPNEEAFEYFRSVPMKLSGGGGTRKKTMFKYTCPDCGAEVKGKRDMTIKCGLCDVVMKMEDEETDSED